MKQQAMLKNITNKGKVRERSLSEVTQGQVDQLVKNKAPLKTLSCKVETRKGRPIFELIGGTLNTRATVTKKSVTATVINEKLHPWQHLRVCMFLNMFSSP